ncbi:MAG: SxtJ family membrane protein [Thiohalocapsa sp.]
MVGGSSGGGFADGAEPGEPGSNRAFGWTVGGVMIAIGAVKAWRAATPTMLAASLIAFGVVLVLLAFAAPAHLTLLNRLWRRLGLAMAAVVNPLVVALLFIIVVTPMAMVMRLLGKRPLQLRPDPAATTYWIARDQRISPPASMRQQF